MDYRLLVNDFPSVAMFPLKCFKISIMMIRALRPWWQQAEGSGTRMRKEEREFPILRMPHPDSELLC